MTASRFVRLVDFFRASVATARCDILPRTKSGDLSYNSEYVEKVMLRIAEETSSCDSQHTVNPSIHGCGLRAVAESHAHSEKPELAQLSARTKRIMMQIDRRKALLISLLAPFAPYALRASAGPTQAPDHEMPNPGSVLSTGNEQIAMLMYPGMTVLDLIGPQSMFGALMGAKVFLVAKSLDPVTSDAGVTITPTATFETCPRDLTVLFTPGGGEPTLAAAKDPETLAFMADRGARAKFITSVCSGSLILGAAGLLKGYKATSHWSVRHVLSGFGAIPTDARVVRDRNRITGAGVTAGLDFGLTMVAELRGRVYAECCQLMSEYDPHPPFNSGSMKTAPPEVRDSMVQMLADFVKKSEALAAEKTS